MIEIGIVLVGLVLLAVVLAGKQWLMGIGGLLLAVVAVAATGLVAWLSLPLVELREISTVATQFVANVKAAPDVAVLTVLGIALAAIAFALRRPPQ
jgi:hypothetical protein